MNLNTFNLRNYIVIILLLCFTNINSQTCTTPGMPVSLSIPVLGSNSATIQWAAGTPVGSPIIAYEWEVISSAGTFITSGITQNLVETVSSLTCNTTYFFKVRAYTSCNGTYSSWATSSYFTTSTCCITPPTPFFLWGNGAAGTSASLQWTPGQGSGSPNISYNWELYTFAGVLVTSGNSISTFITVTGLSTGTQYYFRVQSVTSCDNSTSSWSTNQYFTTSGTLCVTPGAPSNLSTIVTGQNSVTLQWGSGTPYGSSLVTYYWEIFTANGTSVISNNTTGFFTNVSSLTCGTTYYFNVRAYTSCNSTYSSWATSGNFTTGNCCITPGAPDTLSVTVLGPTSAIANWTPGNPAGSPTVYYKWNIGTSPSCTYGVGVAYGTSTTTNAIVSSLACGTTYYLCVNALTSCTPISNPESGYTTTSPFTTSACCTTPGTPTSLSAVSTGQTSASLSWSVGSPVGSPMVRYYWELYTSGGAFITGSTTTSLNTNVTGLTCGTSYYYRVQSNTTCDNSYSSWVTSSNFTTDQCGMLVPIAGNNFYTTCSGHIYDFNGPTTNYADNSHGYSVIYASNTTDAVQIQGSYNTESGKDLIYIFDGAGTGGTLLATFSGIGTIPAITSSGANIPLTIGFTSNGSINYSGFDFTVSCVAPCTLPPTPPTYVSSDLNNFCSNIGGNLSLTGSGGSGNTLMWYNGNCGGMYLGTGNPCIITAPTTTTVYYANSYISGCTTSSCKSIMVSVYLAPKPPLYASVDINNFCDNDAGNINLTVSGGYGSSLAWYSSSCGGTQIGTGNSFTIASPTASTAYYASWQIAGCNNSTCATVYVAVIASPTAPTLVATDRDYFCSNAGGTVTLSASGGIGNPKEWYILSCGYASIGTGNSIIVQAPTTTTTYWVNNQSPSCSNSLCSSITINVSSIPVPPVLALPDRNNICSDDGGTIEFNAYGGSGTNVGWYTSGCGVSLIGTGNPFIISSPIVTTTYWANWISTGCTSSSCISVTITVIPGAVAPQSLSSDTNNFCSNMGGNMILSSSGGSGTTLQWSLTNCGGYLIGTGKSIILSAPSSTITYYNWWQKTGCNISACKSITITVNALPVSANSATIDRNNLCSNDGGNIILSASGGSGVYVGWYTGGCGNTFVGSGNPYQTTVPNTTTTYWASWQTPSCSSSNCVSITINIIPAPVTPQSLSIDRNNFCYNDAGNIILSASGGSGSILKWYTNNCNSNNLGVSNPLYISSPTLTTTYWANWTTTGCTNSTCISVTATVIQLPYLSGSISGQSISCISQTETYSVTNLSGTTYTWTTPSGWTGTSTTNSITCTVGGSGIISVTSTNTCGNGIPLSKYITVNTLSTTADSAIASPEIICSGASSILSVSGGVLGTNANWHWYSGSCNGIALGTGSTISQIPLSLTTYYVKAESTCNTTACVSISVSLYNNSTSASAININPQLICSGASTTLSLTGGTLGTNANWYWYSGSCTGVLLGSGLTITDNPTTNTTYYLKAEGLCNTTSCITENVSIIPASTPASSIIVKYPVICPGVNDSLTVSGGSLSVGAQWYWFTSSCGGTAAGTGLVKIKNPTTTTVYYVRAQGTCDTTPCVSATITINTTPPVAPTWANSDTNNFCANTGGLLTLSSSGGFGTTLNWYRNNCNGTFIGSGNPKVINKPTATTIYFAKWYTIGCSSSSCASKTVTVLPATTVPLSLSSSNYNICSSMGGTITLSESGGSGNSFNWYTGSCGGVNIGTGITISITSPSITTKYWGRWESISCGNSNCKSVVVNVISSVPLQPSIISGNTNIVTGSSEIYSVTNISGTTYTWTAPSGWIGTSTSNTITYTVDSGGYITVVPSNICGSGLARSLYVSTGYNISGNFTYDNNASTPLDSVWVYLMQNGIKLDSIQADINGYYHFNQKPNGTYNITASSHKPWDGVNVTDAIKIKLHFAGSQYFLSSLVLHSGDVNYSFALNPTDAIKVVRRFSGSDTTFDRGNWNFEKPFGGDTINVSTYMNDTIIVNGSNVAQNFKGICIGDVNGSYYPIPLGAKSAKVSLINYNNTLKANANEYIELPIKVNSNINVGAISLILNYPKHLVSINNVKCLMSNENKDIFYNIIDNELRIGWFNDVNPLNLSNGDNLITISLKTSDNFKQGDVINFSIVNNPLCEIADENGNPYNNVTLNTYSIESRIIGDQSTGNGMGYEENYMELYPNPANNNLNINYVVANNGLVNISIFNILGEKVIDAVNNSMIKGIHKSNININSLPSGVYSVKMTIDGNNVIIKKIVVAR